MIYYYTNKQYKETYNPKIVTFRHCYTVRMPSFVRYDFWAKCKYQSQHKCRNTPNKRFLALVFDEANNSDKICDIGIPRQEIYFQEPFME